ncbi:NUDIX hydrolase [Streptomyces mutabilis]|uniref:NUDIX hydrolase n=1 Tax=Streptomyces mutabilis TaxID=67332 RepID=UPI0008FB6713
MTSRSPVYRTHRSTTDFSPPSPVGREPAILLAAGEPLTRWVLRLTGRKSANPPASPGGSAEAGESFEDAVIRGLAEETGLLARAQDVGDSRARSSTTSKASYGSPSVRSSAPGKGIRPRGRTKTSAWAWYPLDQLPDGLFACRAQILTAWRPGLPIDHPPAHFTRSASRTGGRTGQRPVLEAGNRRTRRATSAFPPEGDERGRGGTHGAPGMWSRTAGSRRIAAIIDWPA